MTDILPCDVRTPARLRSRRLAERFELGMQAVIDFARTLTDGQWHATVPRDGRRIGVVVHHIGSVCPLQLTLAQRVAAGSPVVGITWPDVHAMNAAHAEEYRDVSRDAALDLLAEQRDLTADAVRALSDDELDRVAPVSLYDGLPLTSQFLVEALSIAHSRHHLARLTDAVHASR